MMRSFLVLMSFLLSALALPAHAHKPSDSYLSLTITDRQIDGQWDIALRDLNYAIGLDRNDDGNLTWDEIRSQHQNIASYALQRLNLATDKGACTVTVGEQLIDKHTDGAYSVLRFQALCQEPVAQLQMGYQLFADLDPQHKGLVKIVYGENTSTAIFSPDQAQQTISLTNPSKLSQFGAYVVHGVWHIWIGFDHILFLLSLLLPAVLIAATGNLPARPSESLKASFYDVLKVVTAFTLAHSITLTLASLSLISLPSRAIESLIAASVVLAALNNIVPLFRGRRPVAAFVFGLIHGFGFASVLADLGLPQGAFALSLFGFNVGVELGQLAIVAVFLPIAFLLRRTWLYRQLLTKGSLLIMLLAGIWFIERAFDMKLIPF
jgi:hypothetical protein